MIKYDARIGSIRFEGLVKFAGSREFWKDLKIQMQFTDFFHYL